MAPPREILEVKNAVAVYDDFDSFTPTQEPDMLRAHATLMSGLADDAGRYRTGQVGVFSGQQVIHMAPPAARVPHLMGDLFEWLASTTELPLITSCLFHYEFEFIHPFSDGNGRIGRLWQRVIAAKWLPALADLPVESMVHAHQNDYYDAIALSTKQTDCAPLVHFMLSMILQTAKEQLSTTPQVTPQATPQFASLLQVLDGEMSREELQRALDLADRKSFRDRYLQPALESGLVEMTLPDTPRSSLQRYRLSPLGNQAKDTLSP